jgi:hypothetical protein
MLDVVPEGRRFFDPFQVNSARVAGLCKSGASAVASALAAHAVLRIVLAFVLDWRGLPPDHLFAIYASALAGFTSAFPV